MSLLAVRRPEAPQSDDARAAGSAMSNIRLEGIRKSFGAFKAIKGLDLEIREGEFVTLLGGSGSGKTTCLRIVAGFVEPDAGRVLIGGQDVTRVPPYRRNTGMVFQNYALFPHMTAAENIAYGLKVRRLPRAEVEERTRAALALVQLEHLAGRYPTQLSGGQRQRIALARAVVIRPKVMLLDEPLGALDLKLRQELQVEIKRVQQQVGITTLFVTHDQGEALGLSDRIVVMREGDILQVDTPDRLYRHPASRYVADFVGRMNFFDAHVVESDPAARQHLVRLDQGDGRALRVLGAQGRTFAAGERCLLGIRPEDFDLAPATGGLGNIVPAEALRMTYSGSAWTVTCAVAGNPDVQIVLHASRPVPECPATVSLVWPAERAVLLDHG